MGGGLRGTSPSAYVEGEADFFWWLFPIGAWDQCHKEWNRAEEAKEHPVLLEVSSGLAF